MCTWNQTEDVGKILCFSYFLERYKERQLCERSRFFLGICPPPFEWGRPRVTEFIRHRPSLWFCGREPPLPVTEANANFYCPPAVNRLRNGKILPARPEPPYLNERTLSSRRDDPACLKAWRHIRLTHYPYIFCLLFFFRASNSKTMFVSNKGHRQSARADPGVGQGGWAPTKISQ